ncbi:MAG: hypothetical protein KJZ86_21550 [Caldilineaceae bacterium]|nr:hypothetical protein [Caldilineaceae bacterium]HRJ42620.1 hypothetical protein [Caldilineaceae bacterium]
MTTSPFDKSEPRGDSYQVGVAINSSVGHQPLAVNVSGGNVEQTALALARLLAEQRHRLPPEQVAGLEAQLRQLQAQMGQGFADLRAGQGALSAQVESAIGSLQASLLARLDGQEARLTGEILAVLESGGVAADELDRQLTAIEAILGQLQIAEPSAQAALGQAQAVLAAPGLDVRSKLKVTIPLIPFLLDYEGELELGQQMNVEEALAALWRALLGWVRATPS